MKKIHAHGKCFDSKDFENLVIGGQNDADTIRFVVPKIFAGEVDYSEWEWAIHYENKEGQGDRVALTSQQSSDNADNIWIDWTPSQTATQVSGKLLCQLYSIRTVGEETRRFSFHTFSIYVDAWLNPTPITQALPSVMEQALEQMEKYNQDLQDAITSGKNAAVSEKNAATSAKAAAQSETAAKTSETNAKTSESNSKTSETNAKKSEEAARSSEEAAAAAASAAKTSLLPQRPLKQMRKHQRQMRPLVMKKLLNRHPMHPNQRQMRRLQRMQQRVLRMLQKKVKIMQRLRKQNRKPLLRFQSGLQRGQ